MEHDTWWLLVLGGLQRRPARALRLLRQWQWQRHEFASELEQQGHHVGEDRLVCRHGGLHVSVGALLCVYVCGCVFLCVCVCVCVCVRV